MVWQQLDNKNLVAQVTPYLQESSRYTSLTTLLAVWTHSGPLLLVSIVLLPVSILVLKLAHAYLYYHHQVKSFQHFNLPSIAQEWKHTELQAISEQQKERLKQEEESVNRK